MHLIGLHTVDDTVERIIQSPIEKWQRLLAAEEYSKLALFAIENRHQYNLSINDIKSLDQQIDRVYALGIGSTSTAGNQVYPLTPAYILGGSSSITGYWRSDSGITIATGVSAWAPIIGAISFTQVTGGAQPAYTTNDAAIYGRASLLGDGVDDVLGGAINFDPPGTTPTWMRFILNQVTNTPGDALCGSASNTMAINQGTSPQLIQRNTTAGTGNTGLPVNTWGRVEVFYNNNTTDYLKCGATTVTGVNTGNTDAGATFSIFARTTNSWSNVAIAELLICNAQPTALQKALLDGMSQQYYNGTISQ